MKEEKDKQPNGKMGKRTSIGVTPKRKKHINSTHMKSCMTSLVIGEMQSETSLRSHLYLLD